MKDMMGAALLGELVAALAKSTALRKSLGAVAPEDADAMISTLVGEIERFAADGSGRGASSAKGKSTLPTPSVAPAPDARVEAPVRKPFPAPEKPPTLIPVQQPPLPAAPPERPLSADRASQPVPLAPVPVPPVAAKSHVPEPVVPPPPVIAPVKPAPASPPVQARPQSPMVSQVNAPSSVKASDPPPPAPVVKARPQQGTPGAEEKSAVPSRPVSVPILGAHRSGCTTGSGSHARLQPVRFTAPPSGCTTCSSFTTGSSCTTVR